MQLANADGISSRVDNVLQKLDSAELRLKEQQQQCRWGDTHEYQETETGEWVWLPHRSEHGIYTGG